MPYYPAHPRYERTGPSSDPYDVERRQARTAELWRGTADPDASPVYLDAERMTPPAPRTTDQLEPAPCRACAADRADIGAFPRGIPHTSGPDCTAPAWIVRAQDTAR